MEINKKENKKISGFEPIKQIEFVVLKNTSSISLTNSYCALSCKHCNKHYLKGMAKFIDIEKLAKKGKTSFLLSGGLMPNGKIPYKFFLEELYLLKQKYNLKFNLHTGYNIEESDISYLRLIGDVISYDLVGDKETMKEVYGIDNFEKMWLSFKILLENGFKVKPHITIGLNKGKISHEIKTIQRIKDLKVENYIDEIIFLVFIPTVGTDFYRVDPVNIQEVINVILETKNIIGNKNITLGCMVPKGKYRLELQSNLLGIVDKIVQPVNKVVQQAKNSNFKINYSYECCAFEN